MVLVAELFNSAIEALCDFIETAENQKIKVIKDIAAAFDFGRSTIVHHLAVLEKAGILSVRREGRQALYSVCHDIVLDSLEKLRLFIEEDLQEATVLPQTAKGTNP
ncbi:MAG: ArsR family transcriptional regulator [Deltaproteobacteria bacterium]|nr:ArsR family transcriptional regulator [Deltaproteobacteria bacterium]